METATETLKLTLAFQRLSDEDPEEVELDADDDLDDEDDEEEEDGEETTGSPAKSDDDELVTEE